MNNGLPQGWAEIELRECVEVLDNQRVPVNSDERAKRQGDVPYYGATGQVGWIDGALFNEELLLIGEDGAPFLDKSKPISYIIRGKSWVNNHAHVLRTRLDVSSNQYLKYFLDSFDFHEFVNGTTRLKLTQGAMNRIPVRLAPVGEQRQIVAKLEKLLGKVDACQQRLAKIPVLLKRFRQSVLAAACSGRLTADWREENTVSEIKATDDSANGSMDLPETWQWQKIASVFPVETGTTPPKKQPENYSASPTACPFFKPTDLDAGANVREAREWLSVQGEKHARLLPPMTVCVTSIGATIGKTGLLRVRGATNQQINSILPSEGVQPEFMFFYCCSPYFQRRILEDSSSTTLPIINKGRFEELEFPLPPVAEQQEIARRVEALFTLADQIEARYAKAKAHVEKLTQSILAKAFRGELVPQDANDETASVLLERIKQTKTKVVAQFESTKETISSIDHT